MVFEVPMKDSGEGCDGVVEFGRSFYALNKIYFIKLPNENLL